MHTDLVNIISNNECFKAGIALNALNRVFEVKKKKKEKTTFEIAYTNVIFYDFIRLTIAQT